MALLLNAGDTVLRSYSYTQPSSLHPSQPQGTGERTGNLFNVEMEQGSISASGVNQSSTARIRTSDFIPLEAGNYVINASASNDLDCFVFIYDTSGTFVERVPSEWTTLPYAFTLSENCRIKVALAYRPAASSVRIVPSDVSNITLNSGSTALPYEPYGYKIPISSANTTTPIYLGEVQTTRRIKKYEITGNERWVKESLGDTPNRYHGNDILTDCGNNMQGFCSHYIYAVANNYGSIFIASNKKDIFVLDSDVTSARALSGYFAQQYANGTPVTIWYVLANEETGIVNEPLMKIGDYADEVSGITIPTTAGANTLSVDTTLQPSEVTVNYKGWHPITNVHEHNNGAWN